MTGYDTTNHLRINRIFSNIKFGNVAPAREKS